ncbi:MAG TPA: glycosyltransferase family 9 protein, partial [Azospirillaceae bacterium]|nr:glycosyltransferase family 9 protein [Azospirillaceae bacterium]HRQ80077.1 glycosyltransferase family 9 protein [Azospirillaceae bacterium]
LAPELAARLRPPPFPLTDFAATAALIAALDAVVTVDTSIAHLTGALGIPGRVLLPYAPDWRWLIDRADCPWRPSLRLIRQQRPGDWAGVIRQTSALLAGAARDRVNPSP